jgi:hypothetical protein
LGKLKVTATKPSNFPKDHAPQFIFYSPSESFFFRDLEAIHEVAQDALAEACRAMRNANMQGARSVDVLDPTIQRKLEQLTSNSALIPFNDFKHELQEGKVPCPPYGQGSRKGATTPGSGSVVAVSTQSVSTIAAPPTPPESLRNEQSEKPLDEDIDSASKGKYPLEDIQRRAIKTRRGQPDFRKRIFAAYDNKCSVTGCAVHSVLEAAHIIPHAEGTDWHISNGLPLRADIHTLYDLRLLAVGPNYLIHISAELAGSDYEKLHGEKIGLPLNEIDYPSLEKLAKHFECFEKRNSGGRREVP